MPDMRPFKEEFPADNIRHHFVGQDQAKGIYAKELHIPAGYRLVSHRHPYDHLSILVSGRIKLTVVDENRTMTTLVTGPAALTIKAGDEHTLQAITDAHWYCIHPTDETDPEKVDDAILAKVD